MISIISNGPASIGQYTIIVGTSKINVNRKEAIDLVDMINAVIRRENDETRSDGND